MVTKALVVKQSVRQYSPLVYIAIGLLIAYLIWRSRSSTPIQFNNLETWDWVDWKGRQRQIAVHREAKTS